MFVHLRLFDTISNDVNFVIEGDEANFTVTITSSHCINLSSNCLLAIFQTVSALHRTADINAEDNGNFVRLCLLFFLLLFFSIFDLGGCFQEIGDLVALRQLLVLNVDFILCVAELAGPNLLFTFHDYCASLVEDTFA